MPTVLRVGPFRFFFYSDEGNEPPHIHVQRDDKIAKFWLSPIKMENDGGLKPSEIRTITRLVSKHESDMLEKWNEYFGDPS